MIDIDELIDAALMEGFSPFLGKRESRTKRVLRAAMSFASVTEPVRQFGSPPTGSEPA